MIEKFGNEQQARSAFQAYTQQAEPPVKFLANVGGSWSVFDEQDYYEMKQAQTNALIDDDRRYKNLFRYEVFRRVSEVFTGANEDIVLLDGKLTGCYAMQINAKPPFISINFDPPFPLEIGSRRCRAILKRLGFRRIVNDKISDPSSYAGTGK